MALARTEDTALPEFLDEGLITEVLSPIKSGKEATTWLCRAHPSLGAKYAVAKVYHRGEHRTFANDAIYRDGRVILNAQVRRAVAGKTDFGHVAAASMWVNAEYDALCALYEAGADVPEPFACSDSALLMAYVGNGAGAAPQLQHAELAPGEAPAMLDRILWNVALWLRHDLVHGDLSPFNVLAWKGRPVVIDFPQAVDPRFAPAARKLLDRDVRNIATFFARHGCTVDPARESARLWEAWRRGKV